MSRSCARSLVPSVLFILFGGELQGEGAREKVTISSTATPPAGLSLWLVGDLPELGGNDPNRALPLFSEAGEARLTVSLPLNVEYRYRIYFRQVDNCSGGWLPAGPEEVKSTAADAGQVLAKTIYCNSEIQDPICHWRNGNESFLAQPMARVGDGRRAGESRWMATGLGPTGRLLQFYISNQDGSVREKIFRTALPTALLQDDELFAYEPAAAVTPSRLEPGASMVSMQLGGQRRPYEVYLPRGYDDHPSRRYPVVYLHDGNLYFTASDPSARTMKDIVRNGRAREFIVVGISTIDATRLSDLTPPGDVALGSIGWGDRYTRFIIEELKPVIDASYRTLPGRGDTITAGFSLGGLIAAYMAWDFKDVFGRAGCQSGSFWLPNWVGRMLREPRPDFRVYMDTGAPALDNYDSTLQVLTNYVGRQEDPFVLGDDISFVYSCGQDHTFENAGTRLDDMLEFLLPPTEEPEPFPAPRAPLARVMAGADCVKPGEDVCFDGSLSMTPQGTTLTGSRWEFGDGASAEGAAACHGFTEPGTHFVTLSVQNDLGLASQASHEVCVSCWENGDISPWGGVDIGEPSSPGGSRIDEQGSGLKVCAGGRVMVGTSDSFHFVHQTLEGDGAVTAHVRPIQGSADVWQTGVMIRDGLGPDDALAALTVRKISPAIAPKVVLARRASKGKATINTTLGDWDGSDTWLRLERRGDEVLALSSVDGVAWTQLTSVPHPLPVTLEAGLMAAGKASSTLKEGAIVTVRVPVLDMESLAAPDPRFQRGETNGDGTFDVSDAVATLGYLFLGTSAPACLDAADANDSGIVDLSDGLYSLGYLFLGGPAPPPPFGQCGTDPSQDDLACAPGAACE